MGQKRGLINRFKNWSKTRPKSGPKNRSKSRSKRRPKSRSKVALKNRPILTQKGPQNAHFLFGVFFPEFKNYSSKKKAPNPKSLFFDPFWTQKGTQKSEIFFKIWKCTPPVFDSELTHKRSEVKKYFAPENRKVSLAILI